MTKGIFVTGTGTDRGKTYVTAQMVQKLCANGQSAGYYKAVLSGLEEQEGRMVPGDSYHVMRAAGIAGEPEDFVSYSFKTPASPHLAARLEGRSVLLENILQDYQRIRANYAYITVEGCGGIVCPICLEEGNTLMLTDIIKSMELQTVLVADAGLGTLNATALTAAYLQQQGIPLRGVVLNRYRDAEMIHRDNRAVLSAWLSCPVYVCDADGTLQMKAKELKRLYV